MHFVLIMLFYRDLNIVYYIYLSSFPVLFLNYFQSLNVILIFALLFFFFFNLIIFQIYEENILIDLDQILLMVVYNLFWRN